MSGAVRWIPFERGLLDRGELTGGPIRADLCLLPIFTDERPLRGLAGLIDWRDSGRLSTYLRTSYCTGIAEETVLMPMSPRLPAERLIVCGLGSSTDYDDASARSAARRLVLLAVRVSARHVLLGCPSCAVAAFATAFEVEFMEVAAREAQDVEWLAVRL